MDAQDVDASQDIGRAQFLRVAARRSGAAAGAFLLGYAVDGAWARLVRGARLERERYPTLVLGRYRVHHNVAGYVAILIGIFLYPWLLVPFGLGMIVGHRIRDRLIWFIEGVE